MREREIVDTLKLLDLGRLEFRLIQLLPLVQVAWSEGAIEPQERVAILGFAKERGLLDDRGRAVLRGWLRDAPPDAHYDTARSLLVHLAHFYQGVDPDFDLTVLDRVFQAALTVARATGGMLGGDRVSAQERNALREIRDSMAALSGQAASDPRNQAGVGWTTLVDELDGEQVPTAQI